MIEQDSNEHFPPPSQLPKPPTSPETGIKIPKKPDVFHISHLKEPRSPPSIFMEGVSPLIPDCKSLMFSSCWLLIQGWEVSEQLHRAGGGHGEAPQLLAREELEAIPDPNGDGSSLNGKFRGPGAGLLPEAIPARIFGSCKGDRRVLGVGKGWEAALEGGFGGDF